MFRRRYFTLLPNRLLSQSSIPSIQIMRSLAWIAVFSLQIGMFVCGAGIDVCHASDTPDHITSSQIASSQADTEHGNGSVDTIDQTCAAHAAHVFLGQTGNDQSQPDAHTGQVNLLASLNLPEISHLIEQPPKLLHS
ncbi:MAG: hypothetical protein Q9M12_07720 [Mariprofundus sp.]|nr:hypothetical protein [Mariprofundus sp.]